MSILASGAFVLIAVALMRGTLTTRAVSLVIALTICLMVLLLGAYYLIDSFTGTGIDQSALYFIQTGFEGAPLEEFAVYFAPGIVLILLALGAAFFAYRSALAKTNTPARKLRAMAGSAALGVAVHLNPAVHDIFVLVKYVKSSDRLGTVLGDVPENYATAEGITFTDAPKNFVLLILESFERTFLDEALFPGLAPNLVTLEKEALSFADITQVPGTGYTIAGAVASQCGVPLTGSGAGSDLYLPGATCIGDLLNDTGFSLSYMDGGPPEFAGNNTFYRTHGFQTVEGRDQLQKELENPDYQSFWGLFDDSLLSLAIKRIDALSAGVQPFGHVIQTTDTHHPTGGHIPPSCDDYPYQDGSNKYLNSIHCADRLAGEFIRYVRSSPQLKDTVLVVISDHLARPNLVSDILEKGERRNLFMVFGKDVAPGEIDKPGNTLDVGPTILSLIGAETPAMAYGRNLLGSEPTLRGGPVPVEEILDADFPFLLTLWSFPQLSDGIEIDTKQKRLLLGNRFAKLPVLFYLNEELKIRDVGYQTDDEMPLISYLTYLRYDWPFVWVDQCSRTSIFDPGGNSDPDKYCALVGRLGSSNTGSFVMNDGEETSFEALLPYLEDIPASSEYYDRHIASWKQGIEFLDANMVEFTPPNGLVGEVAIRSAAFPDRFSWVANRETGDKVELTRGLTLLGFNEGDPPTKIAHKDTCAYGGEEVDPEAGLNQNFLNEIEKNRAFYGAMAIVAHSSIHCYGTDAELEKLFSGTQFKEWSGLSHYQPYVAILSGNGSIQEFVGKFQISLGVEISNFIQPDQITQKQLRWLPRVARAGGSYQGATNTNSFEAIKQSVSDYELIELDFSWTTDRELVCLSDWQQPLIQNGGSPLSLAEFEARNLANPAFRSCTLDTLANWLEENEDFRVVMDVKESPLEAYRMLAFTHPDIQHRFVPQIYQPEDYQPARDLGYTDIIWNLRSYGGEMHDVINWIKHMDLLGLAMEPNWVETGLPRNAREKTGVLSWVESINSLEAFDALVEAGVAEIYTDYLVPKQKVRFEVVSAGFGAGESAVIGLDSEISIPLFRGSNLIGLSREGEPVFLARYDGCAEDSTDPASDPSVILEALTAERDDYAALAIIVADSALCGSVDLGQLFGDSQFPGWSAVGFRNPYIGFVRNSGRTIEFNGATETALREVLSVEITGN